MSTVSIKRITVPNKDLLYLVGQLDNELVISDGEDHDFYHQYNGLDEIENMVLIYVDEKAVGCGAFKSFEKNSVEIKRMYVLPEARGNKYAAKLLNELECWASELGFNNAVLETGRTLTAAISLYRKSGYKMIANYGQYANVENSICLMKDLQSKN